MAGVPEGFAYTERSDGSVRITRYGKPVTVLRGDSAARFLADVQHGDAQHLMARVTGNYRHGNERAARSHPRNRTR